MKPSFAMALEDSEAPVPDDSMDEQLGLAAGDFSSWMIEIRDAIRGNRASDVPCDGCTACCISSQFIHIGPDETDTLSHIPAKLLFRAPLLPRGHVVLGYDERGHCPMVNSSGCSIYEYRPKTCRTYDCRIFPATGIAVDDDKPLIARQVQRWRFSFPSEADRSQHAAVKAAATFIREHSRRLPTGTVPTNATQLAVLAIQVHGVFLRRYEGTGHITVVDPHPDMVRAEVMRQIALQLPRRRGRSG